MLNIYLNSSYWEKLTICEMCPYTEFFLVRIFPHSDWTRRDTYLSVFSPNAGKYGPGKIPYLDTFHAVWRSQKFISGSVFGKLQLKQISLNLKTSCCNLKIRGLSKKVFLFMFLLRYFFSNRIVPHFFMWQDVIQHNSW